MADYKMAYTMDVNNITTNSSETVVGLDAHNITFSAPPISASYKLTQYYVNNIFLPIVFCFGILGNILNLVIFSRRKIRHRMSEVEKASMTGLISLTVSDMLFCIVGLISHFLDPFTNEGSQNVKFLSTLAFYYSAYESALMNTFLFTSTWIITVMSVERWAAARFPFVARRIASMRKTIYINIFIYIFSIIFNIPEYLESEVLASNNGNNSFLIKIPGPLYSNGIMGAQIYRVVWAICGTFLPIVLLMFCNVMFLIEIHQSRKAFSNKSKTMLGHIPNTSTSTSKAVVRITVILVVIITTFLALVMPSMILSLCKNHIREMDEITYYRFCIALVIANLTQGINFAINFLLYCTMSREFRSTLTKIICRRHSSNASYCYSPSQQASKLMDLTSREPRLLHRDSSTNKTYIAQTNNDMF